MAIPIYNPPTGTTQTVTDIENQNSVSISHTFSFVPRVTVVDSEGNLIFGDIQFFSNSVVITFCTNITGKVYLS